MKEAWVLTERMTKLYLKNPLALLFSFVYTLLIVGLYGLFLSDYMAGGIAGTYAEVDGVDFSQLRWLVDSAAMAGVLAISCILVPLNMLAVMVQDRSDNRLDSFLIAPVSRDKLVFGYWLAPFLICTLLNAGCLFLLQGFVVSGGGEWLSFEGTMQMLGLIVVSGFSSTSILFIVAMLVKSVSIYGTVTGMVSALIGFVTGAFLPVGVFPESLRNLFAFVPAHHSATMMREVMTRDALAAVFGGVPDQSVKGTFMTGQEIVDIYSTETGLSYLFDGHRVAFPVMLAVVAGSGVVFLLISIIWMKRYKKID